MTTDQTPADAVREALDSITLLKASRFGLIHADDVLTLESAFVALTARVAEQTAQLAQCFKIAGADSDGNEDFRIAPHAVQAVTDLRRDYDEACNEAETLRHAALAGAAPVAFVRWSPKHGYAWGTVHLRDAEIVNGDWRSVPLYTHAPAKAREDDARDAKRYRFLRDTADNHSGHPFIARRNAFGVSAWTGTFADDAIDAALATFAEGES